MHPVSVAAWAHEIKSPSRSHPSPPHLPSRKRARLILQSPQPRRLVLAANSHNKVVEKKYMHTPSPQKRQFPADAYSPDADTPDKLDGPTPRPRNHQYIHPIPRLSYRESLATTTDELDGDGFQPRPRPQSQSQSASSARSASPQKVTSLWDIGNGVIYTSLANTAADRRVQLGPIGVALLEKLEDVADGPVFAAGLKARLVEKGIERIKPHQLDQSDNRPMEELLCELDAVQTINALSHRCAENRDHESEWNNRVHTKVLELALGNDEVNVGYRCV